MKAIEASARVLSEAEIERIHSASVRVLENIGIHTPNDEMLALLRKAGCRVDAQGQIAYYPRALIEEIVGICRKRAGAEKPNTLEKLAGAVSTEVFYIDYATRARRLGVKDDILRGIALTDRLANFPAPDALVVPSDVPREMSDLAAFRLMFTYARKPGGTYILNVDAAEPIIEMARVVGREVGFLLDTVSPLKVRKESLDTAMIFAKMGMPIHFCSMVSAMGSAPVTAAGAIVLQNAEYIAGIVMLYCLGIFVGGYPGMVHPMDPSTLICSFGAPFIARTSVACAQMARFYGLTAYGNIALTDSLAPDFQAGFEKAFSLMLGACAGVKGIGCQGIVGADQGNSLEQLVLDDEWIGAYNSITEGIEVTDETIAYDVIERVGRSGSFLSEEHTLEHFRSELHASRMFLREPWDTAARKPSLLERAHARVLEYTRDYADMAPAVTPAQKARIDEIARESKLGRKYPGEWME